MDVIDVYFIYIFNCLKYSFFYIIVFIKNEPMITFYQLSNGINEIPCVQQCINTCFICVFIMVGSKDMTIKHHIWI